MFKLFSKKEKVEKPRRKGPQYIYKPFENALSFRVEHREDKSFVYQGWSKSYYYIIEDGRVYRAGSEAPVYIIIGKGVYDAAGEKLIYKIGPDAVYLPAGGEPKYLIKDSIYVQGTL